MRRIVAVVSVATVLTTPVIVAGPALADKCHTLPDGKTNCTIGYGYGGASMDPMSGEPGGRGGSTGQLITVDPNAADPSNNILVSRGGFGNGGSFGGNGGGGGYCDYTDTITTECRGGSSFAR